MESLPTTSRLRCQSSLAFGGMTYFFHTLPFVRTKGNLKTAVVKRFRGRPCDCAESDACGTFEAIKSSLTQTFSRLGKARTSSTLPSAYRKRSPILNAPLPRPPFSRIVSAAGWADACAWNGFGSQPAVVRPMSECE